MKPAHIAGGHLSRLRDELRPATTASIIAMILGGGAMVAASRSGSAIPAAPAWRRCRRRRRRSRIRCSPMFARRRTPPTAPACAFSPRPVSRPRACTKPSSGSPTRSSIASRQIDPYMQSHPLPAERVRALEGLAKSSPHWDKTDSPALQARHDLARAKLYGFIDPRDGVGAALSDQRQQRRGALRARHRGVSLRQRARRDPADRRADPGAAAESLFPRAQGPGAARSRAARRRDRTAAPRGAARAQRRR